MERTPGHTALRRGRFSQPGQVYNITTATVERHPWFSDFNSARAAARCFEDERLLGDARMLAWVLMPDHAHWLLALEIESLDSVVSRLKSASARAANRVLQRSGALWARAYHDHALRREEDVKTVARYLIGNPLRAGLVSQIGAYPFWNATWL